MPPQDPSNPQTPPAPAPIPTPQPQPEPQPTVPPAAQPTPAPAVPAAAAPTTDQPVAAAGGKKILIVEDETFIADLYARELTKNGFQVQVANDGSTGLSYLEQNQYDLLLLDIMLPGINGLQVLKEWKLKNMISAMPILLLTNLGQDEVIKEAFNMGASGYLIKAAYTPAQVVNEVQNALAGKQAGNPNPNPQSV